MKKELHFENGDLTGEISLHLKEGQTLNELFSHFVHDYNPDRLEPYAFRLLMGKENVLTLFAADKSKQENSSITEEEKTPVKKYKVPGVSISEILWAFLEK